MFLFCRELFVVIVPYLSHYICDSLLVLNKHSVSLKEQRTEMLSAQESENVAYPTFPDVSSILKLE